MTNSEETQETGRKEWLDEAQQALERTTAAMRAAWDATRENRFGALESAKKAVEELGDAIDRGVVVAKERWGAGRERGTEPTAAETLEEE